MFGAFKKIFSKPAPPAIPTYPSKTYTPVRAFPPAPSPVANPAPAVEPPSTPVAPPKPAPPAPIVSQDPKDYLVIPLHLILARLPSTLTACATAKPTDTVAISKKMAMEQLPLGAVRMSFGELRKLAAPGIFTANESFDQVLVELPLSEILPRLNPSVIARRQQTKITVPDGQPGVFGSSHVPGHDTSCSVPIFKPEPQPVTEEPTPVAAPVAAPIAIAPTAPIALPKPVEKAQSAPVLPPPQEALPTTKTPAASLNLSLSTISGSWPEAIKQEIQNLNHASLSLPMARLDSAMKTGRVAFPWGELKQWITPNPPQGDSPHKHIIIVLPLNILAPLFLAQQASLKQKKQVVIGENIPDVFCATPSAPPAAEEPPKAPASEAKLSLVTEKAPETSAAPEEKLSLVQPTTTTLPDSETNPPASPKAAPAPVDLPPDSWDTATFFNPKADWSPREVIRKTLTLTGVSGSLISMSDGLMLSNNLPEPFKPDTISAFLPQIFGRMTMYAKELQFGSLTQVTLTVNNTPCAIYKTGTLFFMVLGKAGEKLPEEKIERIAAELAKHNL